MFVFQAEDGIRDLTVTGVQTCALPISFYGTTASGAGWVVPKRYLEKVGEDGFKAAPIGAGPYKVVSLKPGVELVLEEIGRASCRERVEISVVAGSLKKKKTDVREPSAS